MKRNWLNLLPTIFVISIILSLIAYSAQGNTVQMDYTRFEKVAKTAKFQDSTMDIDDTVSVFFDHLLRDHNQKSRKNY